MESTYDRYDLVRNNGKIGIVPFAKINKRDSDFYEIYENGKTRLDLLSYKYYANSDYGWLILQANPEYGSIEFRIPDNSILRIPYPLNNALQDYKESITNFKKTYD